jgi:RNA polymerase sigma-70 factor (ECF subfamily)
MNSFAHHELWQTPTTGARSDTAAERRLLDAARAGDPQALEQVARRVAGSLYRFGRGFCRDPHDAEDVMQDALVALISSLDRFRGDGSLSSWAYIVARNACARRRKRGARHEPLERGDGEPAFELPDAGAGPEHAAERRELHEALEREIAALPGSLRDVLVLRDVEGLSAAQVGERLGLGERAVKSRLHRARVALRERLAHHMAPEPTRPRPGCPDSARLFSRYLEGELDAGACAKLQAHVSGCEECATACEMLRDALGECAACREAPAPPRVHDAVRSALRKVLSSSGNGG